MGLEGSYFEREFGAFLAAILGDIVRDLVAAEVANVRAPWVSVAQAAELLCCKQPAVRKFIASGHLRVSRPHGQTARTVLVERASIDALVEAAREAQTPDWMRARTPRLGAVLKDPRRGSHPLNDPEQVRAGRLGYQRWKLRREGLGDKEIEARVRAMGLLPK
jgi:excisionase family DNA binding protein